MGNEMRDYHSRMKWEMTRIWQREVQNRKRMMQELRQLSGEALHPGKAKAIVFIHITPINTTLVAFAG